MASRRPRKKSEKKRSASELTDRSTLRGAAWFALQRLAVLEDGPDKAAALLSKKLAARAGAFEGLTPEEIESWFSKGLPKSLLADPVKVAMVFTDVMAMTRRHELGGPEGLDETTERRKAKHQKLAYTGLLDPKELEPDEDPAMARKVSRLDRIRAAERIRALGEKLAAKAAELGEKRSPAAIMAEQLGVKASTVRRWLKDGKTSESGAYKHQRYEREEKGDREVEAAERRIFQELLKAGRKPHTIRKQGETYWDKKKGEWVTPEPTFEQAPVVPKFRATEGYYGGDATSGYQWAMPVRDYLTPTLLEKMKGMALGVSMGKFRKRMRRVMPEWAVFIIVSVLYSTDGKRGHPVKTAGDKHTYGKNVRDDLAPKFPDHANRFVVKDAYSSGNYPTLKLAVEAFDKRLWSEIKSGDRIWVHGVVVWNFRRRSQEEQAERSESRHATMRAKYKAKEARGKEKLGAQQRKEARAAAARLAKKAKKKKVKAKKRVKAKKTAKKPKKG